MRAFLGMVEKVTAIVAVIGSWIVVGENQNTGLVHSNVLKFWPDGLAPLAEVIPHVARHPLVDDDLELTSTHHDLLVMNCVL